MKVDLSRSLRSLLDGAMERARQLQADERWHDAAAAWDQASRHVLEYSRAATTEDERRRRVESAAEFRNLAVRLRAVSERPVRQSVDSMPRLAPCGEQSAVEEVDEYATTVSQLIHRSDVKFEDIAGLDDTKRSIQAAFALSLAQAPAGVRLPPVKNILFYGPAGCGKTLLAAAASNGLDATFFNVKVSDLMSKWFGESPKLVQSLYTAARQQAPGVVFLDEVDALLADREGSDSSTERRVLVSFLSELDGLGEKSGKDYVLSIAATNAPWMLDPAILSRFERKIYIPLPDLPARKQILISQLESRGIASDVSMDSLASQTEGMSGRELERLAKVLIERMVSDANPDLPGIAQQGREAIQKWQMRLRPISRLDVQAALQQVHPETSPELIEKFNSWGRSV